jgi:hypothetical protein
VKEGSRASGGSPPLVAPHPSAPVFLQMAKATSEISTTGGHEDSVDNVGVQQGRPTRLTAKANFNRLEPAYDSA